MVRLPLTCKRRTFAHLFLTVSLTVLSLPARPAVNDIYPGDYLPAPAGQSAFVAYFYDRSLEGTYKSGKSDASKDRSTRTLILLAAHYFDVMGFRANVAISGGKSEQTTDDRKESSSSSVSGFSDPKISATLWPYLDDEKGRYLAVNLAHVFARGSYDNTSAQNIGQNRDRSILSLAWAQRTSQLTMLEVTGEIARFGDNTEYGADRLRLEQRSAKAVTGFFRYRLTDQITPYLGLQMNWGGETVIDGQALGDSVRSNRLYLGLRLQNNPRHIFHMRFANDRDVDSGYGLKREWVLRWTWLP